VSIGPNLIANAVVSVVIVLIVSWLFYRKSMQETRESDNEVVLWAQR
jgi:hypothetical protein